MNLTRETWNKSDIKEFQEYLVTFGNEEKRAWAKNLLRTELPVLCLKTVDMKMIVSEIYKGNYLEFLDLMIWEYYENTAINGMLLSLIKDFKTLKRYLDIYSKKCDNWATCDLLKFDIKGYEKEFFDLAISYTKKELPFEKRIGLLILFYFIDEEHTNIILDIIESLNYVDYYYVNMMCAWLLSECFIKERTITLNYLSHHHFNKFTINKGVQKCRESRRVSAEDKEMLLKYKVK